VRHSYLQTSSNSPAIDSTILKQGKAGAGAFL